MIAAAPPARRGAAAILRPPGRVLRYRERGGGSPPLVLVHGAAAGSAAWLPVLRRRPGGLRVVAPDLPGHGGSEPLDRPITVEAYAEEVAAVLADLGVSRAVWVGHSMGGAVALSAAARWPERVAGLVVVASAARIGVAPELLAALRSGRPEPAALLGALAFSPATDAGLRQAWVAAGLQAPLEVARADFEAVRAWDGRALLGAIHVPALVVGGEDDLLTPPAGARRLAEGLGARLELIRHAGHLPFVERPAEFQAALGRFLQEVVAR